MSSHSKYFLITNYIFVLMKLEVIEIGAETI